MTVQLAGVRPAPTSLSERAYGAIQDKLIMLEIPPMAPIDEVSLVEALEVGRTPVREALKRLEVDRLVVSYPRRGTFATAVDITDLAYISEIRVPARAARRAPGRRGRGRDRPARPGSPSSPTTPTRSTSPR